MITYRANSWMAQQCTC